MSDDVIWLAMLTAGSFEELESIAYRVMAKDELKKFMKDVRDASMDGFNIHEWEREKIDRLVKSEEFKYETMQAREEGLNEGIEQANIQNIKSMLKNNLDIEIISKVSGKSIEEIKGIEKSMD